MAEHSAGHDFLLRPRGGEELQTHLPGGFTNEDAGHVTPQMEHVTTPHDRKAEDASATRSRPLQKRALDQSTTTTPHDREAEEAATPKAPVTGPFKKRGLDQSTNTPGNNRRKRGLPLYWCDWCLSRHENRSDHVRAPTENQAMHDAIASGAMPKVDPWGDIQARYTPRPTIEAPKPLRDAATMFEPSEEAMAHIKSGDPERMTKYIALLEANDEKIRAHKAAEAARVAVEAAITATAANLPTGPPSKKRRRELAARADRQQPDNNRRPRKLPRVANSALTTSESSNTPPTLQQPRRSMAASPAPTSKET